MNVMRPVCVSFISISEAGQTCQVLICVTCPLLLPFPFILLILPLTFLHYTLVFAFFSFFLPAFFFATLLSTPFSFFHLIFLYSISICYFSSNAHLLSSALHFHLCYPPPFSCVFFFHVPSLPVILFSPSSSPSHLSSIPCSPFSLHLFFLSSCKYLSCLPLLYAFCS